MCCGNTVCRPRSRLSPGKTMKIHKKNILIIYKTNISGFCAFVQWPVGDDAICLSTPKPPPHKNDWPFGRLFINIHIHSLFMFMFMFLLTKLSFGIAAVEKAIKWKNQSRTSRSLRSKQPRIRLRRCTTSQKLDARKQSRWWNSEEA